MARLTSPDELRRIIAEPRPTTRAKILDALDEQSIDFLKRCPFALIGTTAADGTVEVSPKGDEPGFIRVEDPKTLLIPERVGNNLAFGLGNILATGQIGLIALVPATGETLRVSGTAEIYDDAELVASLSSLGKPALEWETPFAASIPKLLAHRGKRVVALCSGDPFWYGAGSVLGDAVPAAETVVIIECMMFSPGVDDDVACD